MLESQNPNTQDDFVGRSSSFVDWFSNCDGTRVSSKIALADLRSQGAGRGVVASGEIEEDEELFAIPRSLVLDPGTSAIPNDVLRSVDSQDSWSLLILTVVFELLRCENSPWHQYLQVLPREFDTLMFWSESELKALQGSAVLEKIGKKQAEEQWRSTIIPVMLRNPGIFPIEGESVSRTHRLIQLAHLAGSLIMAYAFDIDRDGAADQSSSEDGEDFVDDDEDNPLKGMVPFADMLNADADKNNARLFQENGYLIMRTIKKIKAGEEILNDYGPLPRSDLLRMYGYITGNYAQYDVVEVSFDLLARIASRTSDRDALSWELQLRRLEQQDYYDDGYSLGRPEYDSTLESALPDNLRATLKALCGGDESPSLLKGPVSIKEATLLAAVLEIRLGHYLTTIAEDEGLLRHLESASADITEGLSRTRFKMAVEVRKGEKEICRDILRLCKARMEKIPNVSNGVKRRINGSSPSTTEESTLKKLKRSKDN